MPGAAEIGPPMTPGSNRRSCPPSGDDHKSVAGQENEGQRHKICDKSLVGHGLVAPWEMVVCNERTKKEHISRSNATTFFTVV
jgi:hypothetical protein